MTTTGPRLLLSDLDETLLGRREALRRWATAFVERRGLDEGAVEVILDENHHGARTRRQFVDALNARFPLVPPLDLGYLADYVRCFTLDDATAAALRRVRLGGWRIGIATNGDQPQLDKIDQVGLRSLVDGIAVSALDGVRKPDPGLMRLAAQRAGASLEGAWMIGDDPVNDIQGAHAAGIRSVWLRHGRSWPQDLPPPTAMAPSFPDAVDVVLDTRP